MAALEQAGVAGIGRDKLRVTGRAGHLRICGDDAGHDARCHVCGSFL